ncbi:hypothetical protein PCANC_03370 [Puccinia coronata f. sp. avenae]|uniref:Uncharacterized protein n=1 Tax=Puccinia coronata f. sp. avenae TaxID=200324 RepID=A0A2N5T8P0_9BASI|nr:hypothetical protein PCASD_17121 [Puccinia coronata f. sp. avenae]PLW21861.1 hypothetical protein PCANC_03370 [Puccinia coronata f. sp. avenae]
MKRSALKTNSRGMANQQGNSEERLSPGHRTSDHGCWSLAPGSSQSRLGLFPLGPGQSGATLLLLGRAGCREGTFGLDHT